MAKLDVIVDVQTKGADKLNGLAKGLAGGAIAAAKIALPVAGAVAGLTALAAEAEKSDARLGQVFKTMKAGAFTTIPALNKQAEAIGQLSSFDDEGIKDAQATLLTFGNVTGEAFDQGLQSAVDMAEFLDMDLQGATIQLGKALNDPVKGITALSKAGVSFSEEQKEMIATLVETGDVAGAQNIILGEMQKQFGGAAEAMSETSAGQAAQAFEDLTNAGEELGAIFLPILAALARGVSEFAHFVQDNIGTIRPILEGIGAVIGQVFGTITTIIGGFVSGGSGGAFAGVFQHIGTVVDFVAKQVFPFLMAMIQKVVAFIQENGPTIGSVLSQAIGAVINVLRIVIPILMRVAEVVFPIVLTAAGLLFKGLDATFKLIGGIFEVLGNVVTGMVDGIILAWTLLSTVTSTIWNGITGTIKGVFNGIADVINGFFGFLNGLSFGIGPFDLGPVHIPAATFDPFNLPMVPHLAEGGIINGPTLALLGERGPEAVVPLSRGRGPVTEFHSHIDVRGEEPFIRNEDDLLKVQKRLAFLEGF